MSIKSNLSSDKQSDGREYPYLGVTTFSDGTKTKVVLFSAPKTGMCVHSTGGIAIGQYATEWNEAEFSVLTTTLTLSNT